MTNPVKNNSPHLLGIDYGTKYIGLAIAITPIAQPLRTIKTENCLPIIQKTVEDYAIEQVVLGMSEGQMAEQIKSFASELSKHIANKIIFHDETLSSYQTRVNMAKSGSKKSKRENKIDHIVAANILQDYLDSKA